MSAVAGKPQLRGLLRSYMKKHGIIGATLSGISVVLYKFGISDPRKKKYADFYKDYDPDAEFERMSALGLMQSTGGGYGNE
uniref:Uncharacterized protein n=1 Tax=Strigamia maritima TaxID=126957 RepID=T1IR91_STRMM